MHLGGISGAKREHGEDRFAVEVCTGTRQSNALGVRIKIAGNVVLNAVDAAPNTGQSSIGGKTGQLLIGDPHPCRFIPGHNPVVIGCYFVYFLVFAHVKTLPYLGRF